MEVDSLNNLNSVNTYQAPEPRVVESSVSQASSLPESGDMHVTASAATDTELKPDKVQESIFNNDDKKIASTLDKAIQEINKKLSGTNSFMEYGYHKATKTVMVKLIDQETKEVIREVPPQKHLDAVVKMWELAGILVDEKR